MIALKHNEAYMKGRSIVCGFILSFLISVDIIAQQPQPGAPVQPSQQIVSPRAATGPLTLNEAIATSLQNN